MTDIASQQAFKAPLDQAQRLQLFDQATARQRNREHRLALPKNETKKMDRGWKRENL